MLEIACPARMTAASAAATYDRSLGCSRSSEVWLRNTRSGASLCMPMTIVAGGPDLTCFIKRRQVIETVKSVAALCVGRARTLHPVPVCLDPLGFQPNHRVLPAG